MPTLWAVWIGLLIDWESGEKERDGGEEEPLRSSWGPPASMHVPFPRPPLRLVTPPFPPFSTFSRTPGASPIVSTKLLLLFSYPYFACLLAVHKTKTGQG